MGHVQHIKSSKRRCSGWGQLFSQPSTKDISWGASTEYGHSIDNPLDALLSPCTNHWTHGLVSSYEQDLSQRPFSNCPSSPVAETTDHLINLSGAYTSGVLPHGLCWQTGLSEGSWEKLSSKELQTLLYRLPLYLASKPHVFLSSRDMGHESKHTYLIYT